MLEVHAILQRQRCNENITKKTGTLSDAYDSLNYNDFFLYSSSTNKPVARLSLKMQDTLSEWEERGYKVKSASVRFVVAWKPKDAQKNESETAVLLADLVLSL